MKTYEINQIENKRIYGRNVSGAGETDKPLALFWAASALEINVKSREVWIQVSSNYDSHEPWLSVEINGYQVSRLMVPKGEKYWFCVANNMNMEKTNLITIIKDTQPMPDDKNHSLFIHQIGISDEGSFEKLLPKKMNIEFIGDSITSGEGLAGMPEEMDWITQWFCASKTYAMKTAKALDAGWSVMSQCGWGLCWGWDGNINSSLPPHYNKVCSIMQGEYQKELGTQEDYKPDVKNDFVVLNLGTNDNGAFFQPPWKDGNGVEHLLQVTADKKAGEKESNIIINAVKDFLGDIRKQNPDAKIIWTWGMIKLQLVPELIETGVEEYKKSTGDNQVYLLEFESMEDLEKNPEDKGSRGHPGPKTHETAAGKLIKFIKDLN